MGLTDKSKMYNEDFNRTEIISVNMLTQNFRNIDRLWIL